MRGRKKKPTVLKILQGNPGRRKLNALEPQPAALAPGVPDELAADAVAAAEWQREIVPAITLGQITTADRPLAIAHCSLWAQWRAQLLEAAGKAHVLTSGDKVIQNPAINMAAKTLALLIRVDAELGLTPSSRARVSTTPATPKATAGDLARQKFLGVSQG